VLGVACFALADGSPRAVSASDDRTLRVWDPLAGTCLRTLQGHTSEVVGVACFALADGSPRAVSASWDTTLRVWDPLTEEEAVQARAAAAAAAEAKAAAEARAKAEAKAEAEAKAAAEARVTADALTAIAGSRATDSLSLDEWGRVASTASTKLQETQVVADRTRAAASAARSASDEAVRAAAEAAAEEEAKIESAKLEVARRETEVAEAAAKLEAAKVQLEAARCEADAAVKSAEAVVKAAEAAVKERSDTAAREEGVAGAADAELDEARRLVELVQSEKAAAEAAERKRAERAAACFEVKEGGRKRPRTLDEWRQIEEPLRAVGITTEDVLAFREGRHCAFWFVRADRLRSFTGTTPPRLQDLRRDHPDWLEQRTISFADGYAGEFVGSTLVVSQCGRSDPNPQRPCTPTHTRSG
jgi:hypothetical protein